MSWRGEFAFGEVWLAFRGASADNRFHAHAAVQFVAAETALRVVDEGGHEFVGPAWAIRSGVRHCLRPAPALTLVLADPQSRLAVELLATLPQLPVVPLSPSLHGMLTGAGAIGEIVSGMTQRQPGLSPQLDRRLAMALDGLEQEIKGSAVAAAVEYSGLSASRLRSLTQAQFGVPPSKLLLWMKVRRACLAMAAGSSLADAAIDAGFADQAHLTRTMADVIGLTPGEARTAAAQD